MARKLILAVSICLISAQLYAQERIRCDCDSLYSSISAPKLTGEPYVQGINSSGSPFFINYWSPGTIFLNSGISLKCQNLKFDGYLDRLIWLNASNHLVKLDKETVDGFCLNDQLTRIQHIFRKIAINKENVAAGEVYAEELYAGKLKLYAVRRVNLNHTDELSKRQNVFEDFEKQSVYYFIIPDQKPLEFSRINKKIVLELFPGSKTVIQDILSAHAIHRISTEADLINVAALIDTIVQSIKY